MSKKYLFPCPACGRKTAVPGSQAGQQIVCACGARAELPTMLELARLEAVTEADVAPASAWGLRHRLTFLGGVLLVAGAALAAAVYGTLPPAPDLPKTADAIRHRAESLSLMESVREWVDLRQGLDRRPPMEEREHREHLAAAQRWFYVAAAIGVAGLGAMATALAMRPAGPSPRK